jgi:site-specific DNA recombinase
VKAAGYVRVSTQEQVEHGLNLEEDKLRIREMCEQRGWELVEIYDDGGTQGDDPNRPGLLRLLAEAQRFDVVIIRAQDRITRDPGIWATVTAALALADVDLETFNGPIDFRSPAGEFSSNVMAAMGKLEKRLIGQRTKQALAARARKGLHTGGPAPFGYRWRDKQLVQMPAEARIVERIFSDYLNGKGQRLLARELLWPQSKVCRIVGSEFYAGKVNGVDGQHEAIISAEVFERARQLRTKRGKTAGGRHADGGHLLTHGMLRCGRCGEAMIPRKRRPGIERDRYICGGRIKHGPGSCSTPSIPRGD